MHPNTHVVWMDGTLVPWQEATVSFFTPGLHYGVAVFEGIRCYGTDEGPAIFRHADHVHRLLDSAKVLGFTDVKWSAEALMDATRETVRANGFADCYIRPLVYLAEGGWNLSVDQGRARVGIAVWEWKEYLGPEARRRGIAANVSSFVRPHPNSLMTKAKVAGNYANSVLARTESMRLGFDEAILLDAGGYVAECTGENLFLVRDGRIYTPPVAAVLEGITRGTLMTLARDEGFEVIESVISRDQLYIADEVFVCGTAAEVVGITSIDRRGVGAGHVGPVTTRLTNVYHEAVRGRHARSAEWLDPVAMAKAA